MTKARTLADMISDGVIGTTELADDVITPVKLDETGSYVVAGLTANGNTVINERLDVNKQGEAFRLRTGGASTQNYISIGRTAEDARITMSGGANNAIQSSAAGDLVIGANNNLLMGRIGSPYINLNSTGVVINELGGSDKDFRVESDNSTHALFVDAGSSEVGINNNTPDAALHVKTTANNVALFDSSHSTSTQAFIRNSNAVTGTYAILGWAPANDVSGAYIQVNAQEDFSTPANRTADMQFYTRKDGNWYQRLSMEHGATVFNENSTNTDFRVESDGNANAFLIDAGSDTASFSIPLQMNTSYIQFTGNLSKPNIGAAIYRPAADSVAVVTNNQDRMVISNTEVNFNEDSQNTDFRVESDTNSHCFFVDASTNNIGLSTSTPSAMLHIGAATNDAALALGAGYMRFRSDSEKMQGESNAFGIYNYNINDGVLIYGNSNTSSGSNHYPAYHFGGYNNANTATWASNWADADPIFTMTRMTGSKLTSGSGPAKGLSDGAHFTNIVKTTTKTELYDNQGQHWFHGQITTNGNIGYQYKTHEGGSDLRAFVAGDGQYIFRSPTDYNHKMWYYDGVNIGTNQGHGHFRVWGESNVSRSNTEGGSTLRLSVDTQSGNIGVTEGGSQIYSASDERLKTSITNFPDGALTKVNALRPVTFDWKYTADEENMYGFIAQEVQAIDPELVLNVGTTKYRTDKNYGEGLEADGEITDTLAIAERKLLPVLVKAMQEMSAKIDALETQNADLSARVNALESA